MKAGLDSLKNQSCIRHGCIITGGTEQVSGTIFLLHCCTNNLPIMLERHVCNVMHSYLYCTILYIYIYLFPSLLSSPRMRARGNERTQSGWGVMGAMERLTEEDVRKLTAAQTNALRHWLRIPYGSKTGTTAEKRERVWRRIRDEEAGQLPRHVWKAIVEHSMAESMPAFDKKIRETGPRTPSKKDSIKVRYPSLTGPTAGVGRLTVKDLVGTSGVEQCSGAQS